MARKRGLLFDHDGVLVDTERWYFEATRTVLADLGLALDQPRYLELMADGTSCWSWALQNGCSESDASQGRSARDILYREMLVTLPIEIPGVTDVLSELAQNHRMAIVTTAMRADFELIHRDRTIVNHFEQIFVREDYERSKPFPDPYLRGLVGLALPADEVLAIEDSSRGLRAALAAGIDCAVVHSDFTQTQDFSGACARLASLAELPGLLDTPGALEERTTN